MARYRTAFDRVHDFIAAGDIYQANLTMPMRARATGSAGALYALLAHRQPVSYGALLEIDGLPAILSRSPELFFRCDASGRIATRPMKGTAPRGLCAETDAIYRDGLARDEKNLAENLMIVDLLRNDLSRLARPGTVKVPELFKIETYATLHQMVSQIEAELRPGIGLPEILRALFPCGSITGAPKIRAMEIIRNLEDTPREVYCGTIGWAAPDGRAEFNVAIRTLLVEHGVAVLNVGGGLVWDSTAASEYEEALWKSRFATSLTEPA
nr:aminodeoxychorismate synthase component I [Phaeobacter sp. J2-8]